jgi:hypothetical protein
VRHDVAGVAGQLPVGFLVVAGIALKASISVPESASRRPAMADRTRRIRTLGATRRVVALATTLVVAVAMSVWNPSPAAAVGTWVHRVCHEIRNPNFVTYEWVDFCVGFDYSGTTNGNRIRAYVKVVTRGITGVIADPIYVSWVRLGDGNGVISTSGDQLGSGTVEMNTPLNYQCHTGARSYYNARAQMGINWLHGGGGVEWDFWVYYWRSVNGADGACSNNYKTYYAREAPYPPGDVAYDFGHIRYF